MLVGGAAWTKEKEGALREGGPEQIPREDSALTDTPTDRQAADPAGGSREDRDREKEAAEPGEDDGMQSSGGLYLLY